MMSSTSTTDSIGISFAVVEDQFVKNELDEFSFSSFNQVRNFNVHVSSLYRKLSAMPH